MHILPEPTADRPTSRLTRRLGVFLSIAALVSLADQVTKALIRGWLRPGEHWPADDGLLVLSHVHNTGAAFGIFQGGGSFLVVAALVTIGALTFYLLSLPAHSRFYPIALSLILGGAVGNLIDRVRLGHVTDFIDPTHYPAFNIADSAIVVGVFVIAALSLFGHDDAREPHAAASTSEPSEVSS